MREATAERIIADGFALLLGEAPPDGVCKCGHPFGPHRFVASFGSPLDGGLYYCQGYPECPCTGTWGADASDEMKERFRET
jgi:hypothetical protein